MSPQRVLRRAAITGTRTVDTAPPIVHEVLRSPGRPLDEATRAFMEPRFGHDFSSVRIHDDAPAAASARAVNARAYAVGDHIAFTPNEYRPRTAEGRRLIAHELAHVVQQRHGSTAMTPPTLAGGEYEEAADRTARAVSRGAAAPAHPVAAPPGLQCKVEFRDVGRGEHSGYDRLPALIARLNAMPGGVTYSVVGNELAYERRQGQNLSAFDQQMIEFIDAATVVPLRLTNHEGMVDINGTGYRWWVGADSWEFGYVDMDDLLASSDLGLQFVLVHFIRERAATRDYARRIGSPSMDLDLPGPAAEFRRAHEQGIQAEIRLLRDFFGDPSIRPDASPGAGAMRVYRNDRGDRFRFRMRARARVEAFSVEVRTRDGRLLTPEEYLELLRTERTRAQVERERLGGATEHRAGGVSVPAP